MNKVYRPGAKGALLDEYERVIRELQQTITGLDDKELITVMDPHTSDDNCRSIQTVLSHVVNSAHSYAIYILHAYGHRMVRPEKRYHPTVNDYIRDLQEAFEFTLMVFGDIKDSELEQPDNDKKILTRWGQVYDIEQLMEHAIVHVMRHRRQIEKFRVILSAMH
ncbi:DinB family protein [Chitinophaga pinensis]|uniref:DinB family protein n=1 Tax=Chitinophaga pinensis TaxID=79329 RepID=A0A5C6LKS3_9BACT|nr:DinB family protein [Chitinophaga pinensis]TWV93277.1 DinB family protein [Chitinophaga pinensis]